MTLFATPNQGANQPLVTAVYPPQTAITTQVKQVPDESEMTAETALVDDVSENETESKTEETAVNQETPKKESEEINEETIITEPEEETVECIDEGDQSLAEYKPQTGGQPNPFENDIPTEIDDRPIEDFVSEGEDRPGEGKHF